MTTQVKWLVGARGHHVTPYVQASPMLTPMLSCFVLEPDEKGKHPTNPKHLGTALAMPCWGTNLNVTELPLIRHRNSYTF